MYTVIAKQKVGKAIIKEINIFIWCFVKGRVVNEAPYQVNDLHIFIWGDGIRVGTVGKQCRFGVQFLDGPDGSIVPAGGISKSSLW